MQTLENELGHTFLISIQKLLRRALTAHCNLTILTHFYDENNVITFSRREEGE